MIKDLIRSSFHELNHHQHSFQSRTRVQARACARTTTIMDCCPYHEQGAYVSHMGSPIRRVVFIPIDDIFSQSACIADCWAYMNRTEKSMLALYENQSRPSQKMMCAVKFCLRVCIPSAAMPYCTCCCRHRFAQEQHTSSSHKESLNYEQTQTQTNAKNVNEQ